MKNFLFFILLLLSIHYYNGQEKIIKVDSATGGYLTIEANKDIIDLINEDQLCRKVPKSNIPAKVSTSRSDISEIDNSKVVNTKTSSSNTNSARTVNKENPKNICGSRRDIPGYMIKVGEAKSEQDINSMISDFRSKFPYLRVEKTYLRPDWRLLAGDYFKKESAQADLKKIRQTYPSAMVINWRIYCNRAK